MSKNVYSLILIIILFVVVILYFVKTIDTNVLISSFVLIVTAYAIALQGFANEKMVENQIRPSVDVSMIFDKEYSGTLFQFLNITKVPALVWITVNIKRDNKEIVLKDDYLNGKKQIDIDVKSWITSSNFLKYLTGKNEILEATLKVEVAPMFNDRARCLFQEKRYRFDPITKEWLRTPFWAISESIDKKFLEIKI